MNEKPLSFWGKSGRPRWGQLRIAFGIGSAGISASWSRILFKAGQFPLWDLVDSGRVRKNPRSKDWKGRSKNPVGWI